MGVKVTATVECEGCGATEDTSLESLGGGTHQLVYPKRWSQLLRHTFDDRTGEAVSSEYVPICPTCVERLLNA